MNVKTKARKRRAARSRAKIKELGVHKLTVYRSSQHTYAQVISPCGTVAASASTTEKDIKGSLKHCANIDAAKKIGQLIGERASTAGVTTVAFDRAGYKYHGRVKALAEAAREAGLKF